MAVPISKLRDKTHQLTTKVSWILVLKILKGGLKKVRLPEGPGGLKALPPTLLVSDIATKLQPR